MFQAHGRAYPYDYPPLCYPVKGQSGTDTPGLAGIYRVFGDSNGLRMNPSWGRDLPAEGLEPPTP